MLYADGNSVEEGDKTMMGWGRVAGGIDWSQERDSSFLRTGGEWSKSPQEGAGVANGVKASGSCLLILLFQ